MNKLNGFVKGVNLGGWLSQGSLEESHLSSFIKEDDIKRIKGMGCDHLRLPVDFENIYDEKVYNYYDKHNLIDFVLKSRKYGHLKENYTDIKDILKAIYRELE